MILPSNLEEARLEKDTRKRDYSQMRDIANAGYGKCEVWQMQGIANAGYHKFEASRTREFSARPAALTRKSSASTRHVKQSLSLLTRVGELVVGDGGFL
jgi:hypothetical protein